MFLVTISVLLEMLMTVLLCWLVLGSSQLMQMDMAMVTSSGTLGISLFAMAPVRQGTRSIPVPCLAMRENKGKASP